MSQPDAMPSCDTSRHLGRENKDAPQAASGGKLCRTIGVPEVQLDTLERKSHLDPIRRGDRTAECEAIETFIMDSLLKK
jgi:hypothetical protein